MPDPSVEESSSIEAEMPVETAAEPETQVEPEPTLDAAFVLLCQAMIVRLEDDLPAQLHAEEIMGWHANGNTGVAWAHAVLLLEQVIGVRLRG